MLVIISNRFKGGELLKDGFCNKIYAVIFILLTNILCISSYLHADVWADRHGTISTAGNVDTGTRYNPSSALKPPLALLWSHVNWAGAGLNGWQIICLGHGNRGSYCRVSSECRRAIRVITGRSK